MEPDGSTAPAPDTGTVVPEQTPVDNKPTYESPNDLDFEMTPEQEKAFVDSTLGLTNPVEEPKNADPKTPETPEAEPEAPAAPAPEPTPAAPEQPPVAPPEPAKVEEPAPESPEQTGVDTSDLWLEVENADGKAVKITLDGGVPDDFQFKSDKQLFEVLDAMQEMKNLRSERESDVETKTAQQAEKASQDTQLSAWENETQTLIDAGLMPEPKLKTPANGKQFTPEEIEADESLKLQNEVYTFMKTENDKRVADGKAPIMSFGTMFNIFSQQQKDSEAAKAKEAEVKLTKERGSMIGGTSAASGGEKPMYVAGSNANIWSVPVET